MTNFIYSIFHHSSNILMNKPSRPHRSGRLRKSCGIAVLFFSAIVLQSAFVSCSDDPAAENYYTFKGDMITGFLQKNNTQFSDFITILQRAKIYDLLSTYGEFTCLAPTNDAFNYYLQGRGLSSVAQLTDADCDTIAFTHVIKKAYFTTDLNDGAIPTVNMNDRYLTISTDTAENQRIIYFINKTSRLIAFDDSMENGVVHTLNRVISPNNDMLPDLLQSDKNISLFYAALTKTGLVDSLHRYLDPNYTCGQDSVEDGVYYHTGNEWEYAFYPAVHKYCYTGFIEPDSVFAAHGITTLEQLTAYAKQVYDETYPQDANLYDNDPTNRKNPLNRFIAYHFIDRLANYNDLTITGDVKKYMQVTSLMDATDYYNTMCPHTLIKCSSPSEGMFINRKGVGAKYTVRGVRIYSPNETKTDQNAINGVYHYIDDILTYNTVARDVVLNERMRFDATTSSPEFMNSGARGRAGVAECTGFKPGSLTGWKFTDRTFVSCRNRHVDFDSYQGDEVVLLGQYDFTFKLPPVPEGTYEIRLGYCGNFASRGVIQAYFDGKPCGIPLDLRLGGGDERIGWVDDTTNPEFNHTTDKAMRNRGYMKGPASVRKYAWSSYFTFRSEIQMLRRIIITTYIDDTQDHYIRFKQVLDNPKAEFAFDYFELCPKSVYDSDLGDDGN
jgi:uncharacterized surface protein with fasciclin (FAS1) repeats